MKGTKRILLNIAKEEFLEKGYENASLRDISKKANVTTGAIYGLFKSKDGLFAALVDERYNEFKFLYKNFLNNFDELSLEEQIEDITSYNFECMKKMAKYISLYKDIFTLILCKSKGTKYENLIRELALLNEVSTNKFSKNFNYKIDTEMVHMLSVGLFTMFFDIINRGYTKEHTEGFLRQLSKFYTGGYEKMLGL